MRSIFQWYLEYVNNILIDINNKDGDNSVEKNCPLLIKGECPHGISGKKSGGCKFRHRSRCFKYMKWCDKHSNGCKQLQCSKLHPDLCVRSLALECFDKKCQAKLHTKMCKRSPLKQTQFRGESSGFPTNRGGQSRGTCSTIHPWQTVGQTSQG